MNINEDIGHLESAGNALRGLFSVYASEMSRPTPTLETRTAAVYALRRARQEIKDVLRDIENDLMTGSHGVVEVKPTRTGVFWALVDAFDSTTDAQLRLATLLPGRDPDLHWRANVTAQLVRALGCISEATATLGDESAATTNAVKAKVVLVGDEAAKKSDLIRPSVSSNFDESYIRVLGMVVSAKDVTICSADGTQKTVAVRVHDIMGRVGFLASFKEGYFHGSKAVLAVCDTNLPETVHHLKDWIDGVFSVVGKVPCYILLRTGESEAAVHGRDEVASLAQGFDAVYAFVPADDARAKDVVEGAFQWLAEHVAARPLEEKP